MSNISFIEKDSLSELKNTLDKVSQETKSLIILSCDENNSNIVEFNEIVQNISIPLIGGIFPQIIYKNSNYEKGFIVIELSHELEVNIIKELSTKENLLDEEIESTITELTNETKSMFVFVDGLAKNINELISALFDNFGLTINYIGGGAGSLSFEQKNVVITNEGVLKDCALIASTKQTCNVGVKHGWFPISEAMKVTKSEANVVIELDYKPAFEVYKEVVEKNSKEKFTNENFFDIAKGFPLGIDKISGEAVVRDPIMQEDNKLICVGDVPTNSFVKILSGDEDSLTQAAKKASQEAKINEETSFTLFIDCISRVLFLEDNFSKELDVVYNDNEKLIGALTLGEIANNKKHYLEFYNKTAVIGNFSS